MPSAQEYIDLAERLNEEYGAFEEAAILLGWAAELAESAETCTQLALSLLKCEDGEGALDAAKKAVSCDPDDPKALNALGLALADQLDWEGARKAFDRAIVLDPTDYAPHFNRGAAAFQYGKYAQAAEDFVRGILLHGEILESNLKYSRMQLELQSTEAITRLIERFRKEAGPTAAEAFRVLDLVARYLEDPGTFPKDAGRRVRVGKELAWTIPVIRFIAERDWKEDARNRRLVRYLDKSVKLCPDDSALRWARVDLFRFREEHKTYCEDLERLVKKHPRAFEVRSRWVSYLSKTKDKRTMEVVDAWLAEDPDAWQPLNERAELLMAGEQYHEALEVYNHLMDIYCLDEVPEEDEDDDDPDWDLYEELDTTMGILLDRAKCYWKLDRLEEAEEDFTKAMEFAEERWGTSERAPQARFCNIAQLDRARFYLETGKLKEALADFDQCVADGMPVDHIFDDRAKVREKLGDAKGAEEDRKKAQELRAENEKRAREAQEKAKADKEAKKRAKGG